MDFRVGDKVGHTSGDFGVGTIVEDCDYLGGAHVFRVAWPMPEGAMSKVLKTPEEHLRPWTGSNA
jgi:hypothetical protein